MKMFEKKLTHQANIRNKIEISPPLGILLVLFYLFRTDSAKNGEWESAQWAHPLPEECKGKVQSSTINCAVDLVAWHLLRAFEVAIAEQCNHIPLDAIYSVDDKHPLICLGKYHTPLFEVALLDGAYKNGAATLEEWQHALPLDPYGKALACK